MAALTLACAVLAIRLFPSAFPQIALRVELSRAGALEKATEFVRAYRLAPSSARSAVRFQSDDSLRTFLELGAGGRGALDAAVRERDLPIFTWAVRFFEPGSPREVTVRYAPDGRLVAVQRTLAEADKRPTLSRDSARAVAESTIRAWGGRDPGRYRALSSSYAIAAASGRVDRTFAFERADRTLAGAPIRLEVTVAGDLPVAVREYVVVPEAFLRRYDEMRSANNFLAFTAALAMPVFGIAGLIALVAFARRGLVRWRPAAHAGATIGALAAASGINELPSAWFSYDTALPAATFQLQMLTLAIVGGVALAIAATLIIAAAEALTRLAFPRHLDWWKLWRYRGTRQVAGQLLGGYALAGFGFAYVAVFYLGARQLLGWWVPSQVLDDPNQIATPLPWLAAIALSLQAAVLEESLFRAIPLSLLSLWIGDRPRRPLVLAAGVLLTSATFAFAHANYPSWPPYSRGVELLLEAAVWAVVFLRYGLPTTVVAHFVYDMVWFGLFALAGTTLEYRITAAIVLAAILLPGLGVLEVWRRQRGLLEAEPAARFGDWRPVRRPAPPPLPGVTYTSLSQWSRRTALGTVCLSVLAVIVWAQRPVLGPPFTVTRAEVLTTADSAMRASRANPAAWTRLVSTADYTGGPRQRFLAQYEAYDVARSLATSYQPAAAWEVRYVRTAGSARERAEEWEARVLPNGALLELAHRIPEDAPGGAVPAAEARERARTALRNAGIDPSRLREMRYHEEVRKRRRDVTIEYADTTVRLPAGASARVRVVLAGTQVLSTRRFLHLPEDFLRQDRARQDARATALVIGLAVFLAGVALGVLRLVRRVAGGARASHWSRRAVVIAVLALAVWHVLAVFNSRPQLLALYDTAMPWTTFVATLNLTTGAAALIALPVVGLWIVANGVRRRVGIPFWPGGPNNHRAGDALVAGSALGLFPVLVIACAYRFLPQRVFDAPETAMASQVPVLTHVLNVGQLVAIAPPLVGLVAALVAAVRTSRVRQVFVLLGLALTLTPLAESEGRSYVATAAAMSGLLLLATIPARSWGSQSGLVWVIAAIAAGAAASAQAALVAATSVDRAAGLLGLAATVGALALMYLAIRRRSRAETQETAADAREYGSGECSEQTGAATG